MVNWKKRVEKFEDNRINAGEEILGVAFIQPPGALVEATSKGAFGLLGMFAAKKMNKKHEDKDELNASAMAKEFPVGNLIVAVTAGGRILVYEQAPVSGKPKEFLREYKKGDFKVHEIKKGTLKSDLTIEFSDNGMRSFDLAKGQDYNEFQNSLI